MTACSRKRRDNWVTRLRRPPSEATRSSALRMSCASLAGVWGPELALAGVVENVLARGTPGDLPRGAAGRGQLAAVLRARDDRAGRGLGQVCGIPSDDGKHAAFGQGRSSRLRAVPGMGRATRGAAEGVPARCREDAHGVPGRCEQTLCSAAAGPQGVAPKLRTSGGPHQTHSQSTLQVSGF